MKKQMRLWIYLPAVAVLTVTALAARTMATLNSFDFGTGYYTDKTLIFASEMAMLLALLVSFSYPIFHKKISLVASFDGGRTFIPAGIASVSLLFVAFDFSRRLISGTLPKSSVNIGGITIVEIIAALCALLAVVSILGFFLAALSDKREDKFRAWFALGTVVFLILYSTYVYFNTNLPINAPGKLTDMTAYLFFALFFLFETRISLGRAIWPMYISLGMCALALGAYSSVPSLIVYLASGHLISDSVYEITLTAALTVFAAARIISSTALSEDSDAPIVSYIKESELLRKGSDGSSDEPTAEKD